MSDDVSAEPRVAKRGRWAVALVVLGCVLVLLSTLNSWVERQALDTDAWVDATGEMLEDDDIRTALSVYLVDELYEAISVEDAIASALPGDFDGLASILAGAIRQPASDAVDRLLATSEVQQLWRDANRAAHSTLIAVIEDDTGDVLSAAGGRVSIDLGALVAALGERIGLDGSRLESLPEDAGVIVLFESDELDLVQDAVVAVKRLSTLMFIAVVALFCGAVYLSGDRRRTVRDIGIGISLVSILVLLTRTLGLDALVDSLRRASDDEPARSVLDIGSSLLRQIALAQLVLGLFLVALAFMVGPRSPARALRAFAAPVLRHGVAAVVGVGLVLLAVLVWIKPGGPISGRWVALGFAALCFAGVAWVQRVAVAEFPDMTYGRFRTLAVGSARRRLAAVTTDADAER